MAEYSTLTPQTTPVTRYLTSDHLGSPRIITGSNGAVLSRRDFMPYGEEAFIGVGNRAVGHGYTYGDSTRQKFTGYERDEETNLDFAQARMHNYNHGRFTSPDPIMMSKERLPDPQSINLYVYVRNNPLVLIDPTGEYFIGTDGKRVAYRIVDGKIEFASNNVSEDLQRMADLISESGSQKALSQFTGLADNKTKLHFEFADIDAYGLHRPHDQNGNVLEWDSSEGKFKGEPVYTKDKDGKDVYVEATISINEEIVEETLSALQKDPSIRDPSMTKEDFIVATFGHEADHNLNKKAIAKIKQRQEGEERFDVMKHVEKPAYDVTFKILKEIRESRSKR